ncbi:MAG: PHP domain-containing protein [Endomicrobiales bacterium]|nr:PHP domain-containing protein [Endomicrobiales bacterium]
MDYIDLHIHTTYSDGTFTPQEAVKYAKKVGLKAISITDHDITGGIPLALEEGRKQGVEIVPGIELSTELESYKDREMHILGYFINWEDTKFEETLQILRNARFKRAATIYEKLAKNGVYLDKKEILNKDSRESSIGRLHFAQAMVREGIVKNVGIAFYKFLGYGKPAYVPKLRLRPHEAIQMILRVGGVPVLAHPYIGKFNNKNILRNLKNSGLQGIEIWHTKHSQSIVKSYTDLANELGFIITGGSDCHGEIVDGTILMGNLKIPYRVLAKLKECKAKLDPIRDTFFDKQA